MPRLLQIASFLGGAILIFVFKAAEVKRTHWTGAQCRDASEGDAGAHGLTASRPARMSRAEYKWRVVLLSILFVVNISCNNASLVHLSLSVNQIVKSCVPLPTLILSIAFERDANVRAPPACARPPPACSSTEHAALSAASVLLSAPSPPARAPPHTGTTEVVLVRHLRVAARDRGWLGARKAEMEAAGLWEETEGAATTSADPTEMLLRVELRQALLKLEPPKPKGWWG